MGLPLIARAMGWFKRARQAKAAARSKYG